ncbi:hypothetical protein [Methyloceanibacter sp.]|uniref:hypothetical protein n=1 Tax=Methyloceanibacter sp. TaxID=1965321 RepID=UPI002C02363A|nr:hypothetical protein [Methyloceanibacter sp.]HML90830.1 hypothetical protein [Methyloceanibacter sp.]
MRIVPNKNYIVALGALVATAAWVPTSIAATAEQRAKCEEMAKKMGTEQRHAHKAQGPGAMNLTHARCKKILAEPVEGRNNKKGSPDQ